MRARRARLLGFKTGEGPARWLLGLGAPLLAAVVWAVFVTPKGSLAIEDPVRLVLELAIFGAGIAALAGLGRSGLAAGFGIVVVIHLGLTFPLDQR